LKISSKYRSFETAATLIRSSDNISSHFSKHTEPSSHPEKMYEPSKSIQVTAVACTKISYASGTLNLTSLDA